jgi:hypothetical protein
MDRTLILQKHLYETQQEETIMELKMNVTYRQVKVLSTGEWLKPQRLVGKDDWTVINNLNSVISKKAGLAGAIRRMQRTFDRKRNPDGSKVWRTKVTTRYGRLPQFAQTIVVPDVKCAVAILECYRTGYGFTRSL